MRKLTMSVGPARTKSTIAARRATNPPSGRPLAPFATSASTVRQLSAPRLPAQVRNLTTLFALT